MTMTPIQTLRNYIGDPYRMEQEEVLCDGSRFVFKLANDHVVPNSEKVYFGTVLQTAPAYEMDYILGLVTMATPPAENTIVTVVYQWTMLPEEFLEDRLVEENEDVLAAAVSCLVAMASDYALLAKTVSIGGFTRTETQISGELRAQASRLAQMRNEKDFDGEAYTNVNWTGFGDASL